MFLKSYFSSLEWAIWLASILAISLAYIIWGQGAYLNLLASLLGATALIFNAKGNPIGQVLVIFFSLIYAYLALQNRYYGELITYAGMTLPMAVLALISWLRHPFEGDKAQVQIEQIKTRDWTQIILLTLAVTLIFYPILAYFNTQALLVSTLSITTSFSAVLLTYKRSPYFALAYWLNDVILMILWLIAAQTASQNYLLVICFATFLVNDSYTFINWRKLYHNQKESRIKINKSSFL